MSTNVEFARQKRVRSCVMYMLRNMKTKQNNFHTFIPTSLYPIGQHACGYTGQWSTDRDESYHAMFPVLRVVANFSPLPASKSGGRAFDRLCRYSGRSAVYQLFALLDYCSSEILRTEGELIRRTEINWVNKPITFIR